MARLNSSSAKRANASANTAMSPNGKGKGKASGDAGAKKAKITKPYSGKRAAKKLDPKAVGVKIGRGGERKQSGGGAAHGEAMVKEITERANEKADEEKDERMPSGTGGEFDEKTDEETNRESGGSGLKKKMTARQANAAKDGLQSSPTKTRLDQPAKRGRGRPAAGKTRRSSTKEQKEYKVAQFLAVGFKTLKEGGPLEKALLTHWEGYESVGDLTWEPEATMREDAPELVADFYAHWKTAPDGEEERNAGLADGGDAHRGWRSVLLGL